MKKYFLAMAVIIIALASFAYNKMQPEKKSTAVNSIWYFTGDDTGDITDPGSYQSSGSQSGCGDSGNVPCAISVPDNASPGGPQDDLEAFILANSGNPSAILAAATTRKTL